MGVPLTEGLGACLWLMSSEDEAALNLRVQQRLGNDIDMRAYRNTRELQRF